MHGGKKRTAKRNDHQPKENGQPKETITSQKKTDRKKKRSPAKTSQKKTGERIDHQPKENGQRARIMEIWVVCSCVIGGPLWNNMGKDACGREHRWHLLAAGGALSYQDLEEERLQDRFSVIIIT